MSPRRDYAGGAVSTTLTSGITATSLTLTIASATNWPLGSNGPFFIVIDRGLSTEEKVLVTSRSGTTLTVASTANRGVDGTTAASHGSGATVEHSFSATDFDEANAHINDTTGDPHPQYLTPAEGDAAYATAGHTHAASPVTKTIRIDKTWAYDGSVSVNTLPGFYVSLPTGQTAVLAAARHALGAGTATASVRVNGAAATGFGSLSLTTTSTFTDPANVSVADGDYIDLDITAAASATELRLSLLMDVTV